VRGYGDGAAGELPRQASFAAVQKRVAPGKTDIDMLVVLTLDNIIVQRIDDEEIKRPA
jgi:hypothetical protein